MEQKFLILKKLRAWIVVPYVDFKPFAFSDCPKVLVNSVLYNCRAFWIIILYLFKKIGINIDWTRIENVRVPLECKVKTKINNVELVFNIRENSDDFYILKPLYEYDHLKYFKPKAGDIFFDVGAHVGRYTVYAGKLVGKNGKVVSIEPNPSNFSSLLENIKLNALENVKAYNLAAADFNGVVELSIPKDFGRSSIVGKMGKSVKNEGYATADLRVQKARKIIACLEFVIGGKLKNKKILDIGCGSGIISCELSKYGNEVVGIDVQSLSFQKYNETYKIKNCFDFVLCNGIALPFKSEYFDVVIANHVIEHVKKSSRQKIISEAYRVLKPNGLLYIATPNKLYPFEPHVKLPIVSYLPRNIANKYVKIMRGIDIYDVELLTYRELIKLISLKFDRVIDLTPFIVKYPQKFNAETEIPSKMRLLTTKLPFKLLKLLSALSPTWILVAEK